MQQQYQPQLLFTVNGKHSRAAKLAEGRGGGGLQRRKHRGKKSYPVKRNDVLRRPHESVYCTFRSVPLRWCFYSTPPERGRNSSNSFYNTGKKSMAKIIFPKWISMGLYIHQRSPFPFTLLKSQRLYCIYVSSTECPTFSETKYQVV